MVKRFVISLLYKILVWIWLNNQTTKNCVWIYEI